MKKVKLFVSQTYSINEDEYIEKIKRDIQDWTELSDDEYKNLTIHKSSIEESLRRSGMMEWNEGLLILRETSDEDVNAVKFNLKEIIDTIAKQAKAREEKQKKAYEKYQQAAEQKKKARELAQLKKLQEKYGENNNS